ncbi:hypothetical protein QEW_4659 [Clostridioides difficile CD160]|nr:hypothetical protein QEW_4659 [Clostridioides difficile CD160]
MEIDLKHVKEQTLEMCLEAVIQDGRALEYVKEQTPEICLAAVMQDGRALEYVKKQTIKICVEALKQNRHAIRYVKDKEKYLDIFKLRYLEKKGEVKEVIAIKEKGVWLFTIGNYKNITKEKFLVKIYNEDGGFDLKQGINVYRKAYFDFLKDIETNKRTLDIKFIPKDIYIYYFLCKFRKLIRGLILTFGILMLIALAVILTLLKFRYMSLIYLHY